jgi:branched-chain amino acid transport system permease protein
MIEPESSNSKKLVSMGRAVTRVSVFTKIRPAWWGVLAMGLITLFFATTQSSFNLYIFDSVMLACLGAIALNMLMGTAGQVSIGNSAFLLVGAFAAVFCLRAHVPFPLDLVIATLFSGLVGALVGLPALRLRSLFLALATLAAFFIAVYFGNLYQSRVPDAASGGFTITPLFSEHGLVGGQRYWAWLLFVLVSLLVLGASRLMRERSGRAWRMIRDHELVAPTLGINVARYKLVIFILSSMVIGFEGALAAHFTGSVTTDNYTLLLAIQYVAMILIGGLDSILGAVIGASIIVALPSIVPKIVAGFIGPAQAATNGPQIAQIIYGVLIIVFITSSPEGIVGWLRGVRHWRTSWVGRWVQQLTSRGSSSDSANGMGPGPKVPEPASVPPLEGSLPSEAVRS